MDNHYSDEISLRIFYWTKDVYQLQKKLLLTHFE